MRETLAPGPIRPRSAVAWITKSGSPRVRRPRARQADLEAHMAHVDRGPILADLVTADDLRAKWEDLRLHRQRSWAGNDLRQKDLEARIAEKS